LNPAASAAGPRRTAPNQAAKQAKSPTSHIDQLPLRFHLGKRGHKDQDVRALFTQFAFDEISSMLQRINVRTVYMYTTGVS
jgi:hypothetical protein